MGIVKDGLELLRVVGYLGIRRVDIVVEGVDV